MKTKLFLTVTLLSACLTAGAQQYRPDESARKLSLALYAITNLYVDKVDEKKMTEGAIVSMLNKLDPHSEYSDPEETKRLTEPLESNFDGIGIQFNMLMDTLYVVQVISGGPSEKVGLLAGDRIILVEDTLIAGVEMKNTDIQKRLRGPRGTEVHVKVKRSGRAELLEFKITRGKIPITSLDAAYMADRTTGYIRLSRFATSSVDEFNDAMSKLKKQGMQNLILDLQNNGGGYMHVAHLLADELLGDGKLIVYTQGDKQPRESANATPKGNFEEGRLVVMVDQFSASASEIVSGAVQDWDRGVILGRRTFGKGLVQKPIPMPDGSMIRLTVARYYTPSGRNIQKPYTSGNSREYDLDLIERYNRGELMSADSTHFPDSLKFNTLVSKRTVYGGGGIMPDVFIPLDTALYTDYHRKVVNIGLINQVAIDYLDRNRTALNKKYRDIGAFKKNFEVTAGTMQSLQELAAKEQIEFEAEQYAKSEPLMKLQIKALIARDLFDMSEYYQIINDENKSLREALRIINDPDEYNRILGV
ncbi:MAG: S41 family peptidase [Tannerella sp.]|jgi:carboxyl-terminal processing protease|nr:S41 family peptidase [Tannerella sp.]